MTPKSLLREPRVASSLADLTVGTFQPVLDDPRPLPKSAVTRLLLCSGKVYVDLIASPLYADATSVAIARIEQLNPFPAETLQALLATYPNLSEIVWVQEEPENMGAYHFAERKLRKLLPASLPLTYIGRGEWASPAEGKQVYHNAEQERIVTEALTLPVRTASSSAQKNGRNGVHAPVPPATTKKKEKVAS
jgi:2-oxoglutarate dehydrogenase E1 component